MDRGEGASEPKNITPKQRVKEFPDQCLATMGAGAKLFCTACPKELTLKRMSLLATLLLPSTSLERAGLLLESQGKGT